MEVKLLLPALREEGRRNSKKEETQHWRREWD